MLSGSQTVTARHHLYVESKSHKRMKGGKMKELTEQSRGHGGPGGREGTAVWCKPDLQGHCALGKEECQAMTVTEAT